MFVCVFSLIFHVEKRKRIRTDALERRQQRIGFAVRYHDCGSLLYRRVQRWSVQRPSLPLFLYTLGEANIQYRPVLAAAPAEALEHRQQGPDLWDAPMIVEFSYDSAECVSLTDRHVQLFVVVCLSVRAG